MREAPPIVVQPFTSSTKKVERAMEVMPYCNSRQVRLVDTGISLTWLENLLGFPMAGHDDAVDASVAGIQVFAGVVPKGRPAVNHDLLDKVTRKRPKFAEDDPEDED